MTEQKTEILVVGGGTGGCAAALAVASMGKRVILTEETDWLGGQFASQIVPPDEHQWIEQFGCTRRYRQLRDGIRDYYREHYPLTSAARQYPHLNPGLGGVSRLCHEPRVSVAVLDQMMAFYRSIGLLRILLFRKPVSVQTDHDRVCAVTIKNLLTAQRETINAKYVLDATELGDLLPLAQVEYVTGTESRDDTGEPHARPGPANPDNVQAFAWCFAAGYDPDGHNVIDKPADYDEWRAYIPPLTPPWSGKLFSWIYCTPSTLKPVAFPLFSQDDKSFSWWRYRRIIARKHYASVNTPHEVTVVNWPQNDYVGGNIIDKPSDVTARYLAEAKQLSLSFFYWMQTEAARHDGGRGYPGLYLRPDITGTEDGFAKHPYIRESRRIHARFRVTEEHVGKEARKGKPAENFADSVGIGSYHIDLHPSTGGDNYIDFASLPFQIPLGALIPIRMRNLLPACKNIGTTHITNGCYRLHPVEWSIGEASGLLACFCLDRGCPPVSVYENKPFREDFQKLLVKNGIELEWPAR